MGNQLGVVGAGNELATPINLTQVTSTSLLVNHIINGGMQYFQRQTPGTPTLRNPAVGQRAYGPDRFAISCSNASGFNVAQGNTGTLVSPGLISKYYAAFTAVTNAQKLCISQVIESDFTDSLRANAGLATARIATFQCAMQIVGANVNVRLGMLTSTNAVNTIPATFISAFNAVGTDPTFGANLSLLTPTAATGGTISGSGVTCPLVTGSNFAQFSASFLVPATAVNVIPVIFTSDNIPATFILNVGDVALTNSNNGLVAFDNLNPTDELLRCQRYYWKSFLINTAPIQNAGLSSGEAKGVAGKAGAVVNNNNIIIRFPTSMVQNPTITTFNPNAANAQVRDSDAGADCSGTGTAVTTNAVNVGFTGNAATAVGNSVGIHLTADAEI